MARTQAAQLIDIACPLLRQLVNHGSRAMVRCSKAPIRSGGENEDVALYILYRHMLEMVDGAEVLLSESCAEASVGPIRAAFEASLSLDYIVKDPAYPRRSLSWLHEHTLNRIARWEQVNPATDRGQAFRAEYRKQFPTVAVEFSDAEIDLMTKAAAQLRSVLAKPQFAEIVGEHAKQRLERRFPAWFSLFGGPRNVRSLSDHLARGGEYGLFYGEWSQSMHAVDATPYLRSGREAGRMAFVGMRNPRHFKDLAFAAAQMMINTTRQFVEHFRPGENLSLWYERDIREPFMRLQQLRVTVNEEEEAE